MVHERIRVGVVGASPGQGWSSISHIPALGALPDFEVVAVATSRRESAERAARTLGASHGFDNGMDLIRHPDVDLVSIVVKVPDHYDLVMASIRAGKHVYCEWPLGRTSTEAERLLAAAEAQGVKHMVGLQARMAPAVERARELIGDGFVGDILATTLITGTPGWGPVIDGGHRYILEKANGVTLLAVVGGHHCDTLSWLTGGIHTVSGCIVGRRTQVRMLESREGLAQSSPDQVALSGELSCGAPFVVQLRGGRASRSDLTLEVIGTDGELVITSDGNVQMSELVLKGSRAGNIHAPIDVKIDPHPIAALAGTPAYNVAKLYQQLARSIKGDRSEYPTFVDAVRTHHLLDASERAALSGARQEIARS